MGEAPQAHDRQASAHVRHQESTPTVGMGHFPDESFADIGQHAPFHSQFDTLPPGSHALSIQHSDYLSGYNYQCAAHHPDTRSVGHALPGSSFPSSASAQGFTQQIPSYIGRMPVQTLGVSPRSQVHQYGAQTHSPNPTMQLPMSHVSAYPSVAPHYRYVPYGQPGQMSLQSQERLITGYPTTNTMPYNNSGLLNQLHRSAPYLSHPRRDLVVESTPSYPRGPPRKPKQSGHALWVGNLPPDTTIGALKDHFSLDATDDIESVFLISKSNCAFVNYCDESACVAAMARFHESRFQGVRLVCRLRRDTTTGEVSSSNTPDVSTTESSKEKDRSLQEEPRDTSLGLVIVDGSANQSPKKEKPQCSSQSVYRDVEAVSSASNPTRVPEKYFVVKSLTLADLEASVRNGVWATQSHNEVALNHAYETAENVFLVFSANKSGEYFGYARMLSPIATTPNLASSVKLQPNPRDLDKGPKSIPTPATRWAPEGRIVDDSARGTIFWEVARSDPPAEDATTIPQAQQEEEEATKSRHQTQEWGKSFQVEWISTNRLPFYRTRGLRNPWNENREVKIARDGTEIEPSIGSRLVQMFHRPVQIPQGAVVMPVDPRQHYTS
ncbi:hypothetical protein E4T39_06088 [Aureobasidium subglaciale]|nr:hypothetical protein E4T39_06088 [Aureobasidium subglaciale]